MKDDIQKASEDLSDIPDYVLPYIAPMQCGEKERAELIRRNKNAS